MKVYTHILLLAIVLSLLGVTCNESPYMQADDLTGIVLNANNERISGVQVVNLQPFSSAYSNFAGEYLLNDAFPYWGGVESKDPGCLSGTTSPSKVEQPSFSDFAMRFTHPDYDTTIVVISQNGVPTANITFIIQDAGQADGRYDTLFSAQEYNFGKPGETRVIPTIIMKNKTPNK